MNTMFEDCEIAGRPIPAPIPEHRRQWFKWACLSEAIAIIEQASHLCCLTEGNGLMVGPGSSRAHHAKNYLEQELVRIAIQEVQAA